MLQIKCYIIFCCISLHILYTNWLVWAHLPPSIITAVLPGALPSVRPLCSGYLLLQQCIKFNLLWSKLKNIYDENSVEVFWELLFINLASSKLDMLLITFDSRTCAFKFRRWLLTEVGTLRKARLYPILRGIRMILK